MDSSVPSTQSLRPAYLDQSHSGLSTPAKELVPEHEAFIANTTRRTPLVKRKLFWLISTLALIVVVLVIVLPIVFTVGKKNGGDSSASSGSDHGSGPAAPVPTG